MRIRGFALVVLAAACLSMVARAGTASANDCVGFETVDGCVTVDVYNELFSVEALADTPSLSFPGRSVADVYQLGPTPGGSVDSPLAAADRSREFGGEQLLTVRELLARVADATDNPALAVI